MSAMLSPRPVSALILAEPGPMREGLWELVSAMPQVKLIGAVADEYEAIQIVKKKHPVLVIFENHFNQGEERSVIHEIKTADPDVICVVMARDVEQSKNATDAGADSVQMTGIPAGELYRKIQLLLEVNGTV